MGDEMQTVIIVGLVVECVVLIAATWAIGG